MRKIAIAVLAALMMVTGVITAPATAETRAPQGGTKVTQEWIQDDDRYAWNNKFSRTWKRGEFELYVNAAGRDAYRWKLQRDGNLVTLQEDEKGNVKRVVSHTNTAGRISRIVAQTDGNLVMYDSLDNVLWNYRTPYPGQDYYYIHIYSDWTAQELTVSGTSAKNRRVVTLK